MSEEDKHTHQVLCKVSSGLTKMRQRTESNFQGEFVHNTRLTDFLLEKKAFYKKTCGQLSETLLVAHLDAFTGLLHATPATVSVAC